MHKKKRWHASFIVAVLFGGLSLTAWQGSQFPRVSLASMLPSPIDIPRLALPIAQAGRSLFAHHARIPVEGRTIRVRLLADHPVRSLELRGQDLSIGTHALGRSVRLVSGKDRIIVFSGTRRMLTAQIIVLRGATGSPIQFRESGKHFRQTKGQLRVAIMPGGLEIVNRLDLEDYVLGTVQPELGDAALPAEAIKAQIIASRSYVLALHDRHPGKTYDFCDGAHCLMYAGTGPFSAKFMRAADEVRGLYLSYHGHPAAAFFHHGCGGETAAADEVWPVPPIPYLQRVVDGTPANCRTSSRAEWDFQIDRASLQRFLAAQGWLPAQEALEGLRVIRKDRGGRARQILIESSQSRWVSANRFRAALNHYYQREMLFSTHFQITRQEGGIYRFDGKGWGHGVGMCQAGALHMAKTGKTVNDILSHYYPGTVVTVLSPTTIPAKPDPNLQKFLSKLDD